MKKVTTAIIGFFIFVSMSLVTLDIYTKKQIDDFIKSFVSYHDYIEYCKPYRFNFLLYDHYDILSHVWDKQSNSFQKVNYREKIANNPSIVHTAINIYGDYFVKQVSSQLEFYADKSDLSFSSVDYWNCQKSNIIRYQLLIKELLALSDKELDYFISIVACCSEFDEARSYGLKKWLIEKKLIESDMPVNEVFNYPGDFILCTQRFTEDFTLVSNREFLTHAAQACKELIETIDKYKYD